jgi:hypothetical protein
MPVNTAKLIIKKADQQVINKEMNKKIVLITGSNSGNPVDTIIAKEGTIDVLVNNAGTGMTGVAESFTTADVQEMFDVKFKRLCNPFC